MIVIFELKCYVIAAYEILITQLEFAWKLLPKILTVNKAFIIPIAD